MELWNVDFNTSFSYSITLLFQLLKRSFGYILAGILTFRNHFLKARIKPRICSSHLLRLAWSGKCTGTIFNHTLINRFTHEAPRYSRTFFIDKTIIYIILNCMEVVIWGINSITFLDKVLLRRQII